MKPEEQAPDFELPGADGKKACLSDFRGKKTVLCFYPKNNMPGCAVEACEFSGLPDEFRKKAFIVIGVSVDDEKPRQQFTQKYDQNVALLSDKEKKKRLNNSGPENKKPVRKKILRNHAHHFFD